MQIDKILRLGPQITPPLWRDLGKISTSEPGHSSFFLLEFTDFKNVIREKIPLPHSNVAKVKILQN